MRIILKTKISCSLFGFFYIEPFPDDAPRALQDKALHMYAVVNINERTRKQDKYDVKDKL